MNCFKNSDDKKDKKEVCPLCSGNLGNEPHIIKRADGTDLLVCPVCYWELNPSGTKEN